MEYGIRKLTVTLDPKAIKILEEKEKKNKIKEDAVINCGVKPTRLRVG